jgi:hypothetical protein
MIDYELAKRLKDAGFPGSIVFCDCHSPGYVLEAPNLSELIEACGKNFTSLAKEGSFWCARGTKYIDGSNWYEWTKSGNIPEIAVANLWLSLQKHT